METKITHIEKQRVEGILNPLLIQQAFEFSEMEYKQMIYDLGIQFLKELYQEDTEMISILESSIYFWKWWKAEFMIWEKVAVEYIIKNIEYKRQKEIYRYMINNFKTDESTFLSFENFIKLYVGKIHTEALNKQVINK